MEISPFAANIPRLLVCMKYNTPVEIAPQTQRWKHATATKMVKVQFCVLHMQKLQERMSCHFLAVIVQLVQSCLLRIQTKKEHKEFYAKSTL